MALRAVPRTGRKHRRPQYPFQITQRPWQIQPFMLAPVLPGETLKNLLMQARVVSDPVKNPLIGWWMEYYFFYVKHRDLDIRDDLTAMMLDKDYDLSAHYTAAKTETYHGGGTIDWATLCLNRIVDCYFRDEDEIGTAFNIGNLPAAQINIKNWTDSLVNEDVYQPVQDIDVDADADGTITAGEIDAAMRNYEWLRANNLTNMSYEDFLGTYGVRPRREELHRPELIRYVKEWSYPTNHVEPSTGVPSSALSWAIAERADKDRFFREPGFVIGLTVARPKVYLARQTATVTGVLNNAIAWLPALLSADPNTSLQYLPADAQPLDGSTDGFWFDVKDLFLYGEQFTNLPLNSLENGFVQLPTAQIQSRYATGADADALFSGSGKTFRTDGVVTVDILTMMEDTTPQGIQG